MADILAWPKETFETSSEGTVAVKLLFTTATVEEVPYLKGSPKWIAHIGLKPEERQASEVRLIQIDLAVRDRRAYKTGGWVFGSYQYDGSIAHANAWQRVTPVALTWGNDEYITQDSVDKDGAVLRESWVNPLAPIAVYRASQKRNLGWAGRANGPVDDETSSCLSCHSTAQHPFYADFVPPSSAGNAQRLRWFRNLKLGEAFNSESQSLDFSLQLATGISNFYAWVKEAQCLVSLHSRPKILNPKNVSTRVNKAVEPSMTAAEALAKEVMEGALILYAPGRDKDDRPAPRLLRSRTAPPP